MIQLHRLTHPDEPVYLNPDLIMTIEAHPDTVVSLTTAAKFVVAEPVDEVISRIREWRSSILVTALAHPEVSGRKTAQRSLAQVVQLPVERGQ